MSSANPSGNGQQLPASSTAPKLEVNGYNIPKATTSSVNQHVTSNANSRKPPTVTTSTSPETNTTTIPSKTISNESNGLELKRTKSTTSTYEVNTSSFLEPKDYTLVFPWKKIGSFVDSQSELSKDELQNLAMDEVSAAKLETYVYEKYYADIYWNCSLVIGACFAAWCFTYLGFGFFSYIFVLICTFAVYRAEFRRFNVNIRDDMQRIQSKENLEKKIESMDWLNNFLAKFWVIYMPALSDMVVTQTNNSLETLEIPPPIDKLSLDEFTLGTKAPKITSIKSFTKLGDDTYQMDWGLNFSPNDVSDMTMNELKNKIDPKIALGIRVGKGFAGLSFPVLIEDFAFIGNLRIKIKLGDTFPHVDILSICFLEPPKIEYSLKPVGGKTLGFDVMSVVPFLSDIVKKLVDSNLGPMLYYPNTLDIVLGELLPPPSAVGCLQVKIRGSEYTSKESINPYIKYGLENDATKQFQTDIKADTIVPLFNESNNILVNGLNTRLKFELFNLVESGDSLSLGEAFFELQDLLQEPDMELNETKFVKNNKNVGRLIYDLKWYPVLKPETLPDGTLSTPPDSDTGIIDLTVISADDLDTSKSLVGKLTTYIEAYIDNKLVETSRIIKSNNTPEYNFKFENLIYSKAGSILKLVVKDISSFKTTTIAEYETKILDLTLLDKGASKTPGSGVYPGGAPATTDDNKFTKNFTKGEGSFKFTTVWKPLGSISDSNEDDTTFIPPIGTFKVNVKSCSKLANIETLGTIDPYVDLVTNGKIVGKTPVAKNTLNPTFDEEFYVPILSKHQSFRFNCYDQQNKGRSDRLIGDLNINLSKFFQNPAAATQGKTVNLQQPLSRNGKQTGTIELSLTYYPLLPMYSHQELEQLNQKSREAKEKSEDLDELEEQSKFLEDYKKHPDDYEWVDIDENVKNLMNVESNKDKIILSIDDLMNYNSGVLGINLISGKLSTKNAYLQAFIDDQSSPVFLSRKAKHGKLGSASGAAFVRDLKHSILNFRIVSTPSPKFRSDIIYENVDSFNVYDLLKNGYDKPVDITLDNNKISFMFEFVPCVDKTSFATVEDTGLLNVAVISASNLISADTNGKSDPFVVGLLGNNKVFKTQTIKKTLNPEFNEKFSIPLKSRKKQPLKIEVYDWDMAGDNDFLGETYVDLSKLPLEKEIVGDFKLDKQGSVKLGFTFKPGYIKPSTGQLLVGSGDKMDMGLPLNTIGTGVSAATGLAGGVATGAVGAVGTVGSVGVGAVGAVGGMAGGIGKRFLGKKDSNGATATNLDAGANASVGAGSGSVNVGGGVENGGSSQTTPKQHSSHHIPRPHLKLKPSFMGKSSSRNSMSEISEDVGNDSTVSRQSQDVSFTSPNPNLSFSSNNGSPQAQMRIPSSPGTINHDNYVRGRPSMDAVSVKTNAFSGSNAIAGRLRILELIGVEGLKDGLQVKVNLRSGNGTEKSVYKSKAMKPHDGSIKWNENVAFKCDSASSMVFILRSHHTFGKDEEFGRGEIVLENVVGVKDDVTIPVSGKVNGSLVVNFNYS